MIAAVLALAVLVPLAMRRIGDLAPALIMLGTAAFVVFALPSFPASPVACLDSPKGCTGTHLDWLMALAFALPLALGCLYKEIRGDRRGATGRRLP